MQVATKLNKPQCIYNNEVCFYATCAAGNGTGLAVVRISECLSRSIAPTEKPTRESERDKVLLIHGASAGATIKNQVLEAFTFLLPSHRISMIYAVHMLL